MTSYDAFERLLIELESLAQALRANPAFQPQQRTFITHIHNTATQLNGMFRVIPATDAALTQILPVWGDTFRQPQTALFGYARMLLEFPDSFGGAVVEDEIRPQLQAVYERGLALAQLTDAVVSEAFEARLRERQAPSEALDLMGFFAEQVPIYSYWLRDVPAIMFSAVIAPDLPKVWVQRYHLGEIVRHVILTSARELLAYGQIQLEVRHDVSRSCVTIGVFCTGTQLNPQEWEILFHKNGRHLILAQLRRNFGDLHIQRQTGRGTTLGFDVPLLSSGGG